jgi:alpha-tubulin N-acetyltransferase 1
VKSDGYKCVGFIKVGSKALFVRNRSGNIVEMKPLCVLDFFVDASVQRGGHGKHLFDAMLAHQSVVPAKLAYDRPSPKLLGFLRKYFGLTRFVQQNNNYVVFDDFYTVDSQLCFNESKFGGLHGKTSASGWINAETD